MAAFRLDPIATLARQMGFAPRQRRLAQLVAAEDLLLRLDPEKAYPLNYLIHSITGYRSKEQDASAADTAELLTGMALLHDLGVLIETVSDEMDLPALDAGEPVLTLEDAIDRFGVTSKTIQRWRRRGLPARRWVFADGRKRVGFRLSCVERFIARQEGASHAPAGLAPLSDAEEAEVLRHSRRLAGAGHTRQEVVCRVARRVGRSSLAVLHTLERHDQLCRREAILPGTGPGLTDAELARLVEADEAGLSLAEIAAVLGRPRVMVYRVLLERRAEHLAGAAVRFHDDPLYHIDPPAEAERQVDGLITAATAALEQSASSEERRVPRGLPPYLADLYRTPLLTPQLERALFLRFNFHKCRFATLRARLDPHLCRSRDLALLERHLRLARDTKNSIVTANLRLVVSVARRHLRGELDLMELVSDGNLVLMRAVDGFDVHKGFRFSTYATLALMKGFARSVPAMQSDLAGPHLCEERVAASEDALDRLRDRDEVDCLLDRLDEPERRVILSHFGFDDEPAPDLSPRRLRQIEHSALAKLRAFAETA